MKDYIDFVDGQPSLVIMLILIIIFLTVEIISCYFQLRQANNKIKTLSLEKELLFEEQADLKATIKSLSNHLN
jgi:cell division protein FtsL